MKINYSSVLLLNTLAEYYWLVFMASIAWPALKIYKPINLYVCYEREFYSILLANTKKYATAQILMGAVL